MDWRRVWSGWLGGSLSLLVCLVVVSSAEEQRGERVVRVLVYIFWSLSIVPTAHLDAALHHYDTLTVDQISHTPSADRLSHTISLTTLDRHFHMVLVQDRSILAKDFAIYSVDGEGHRHRYDIDPRTFLHGHLKGTLYCRLLVGCGMCLPPTQVKRGPLWLLLTYLRVAS